MTKIYLRRLSVAAVFSMPVLGCPSHDAAGAVTVAGAPELPAAVSRGHCTGDGLFV